MTLEEYVVARCNNLEEENAQLSTALEIRSLEKRHAECDLMTVLGMIECGIKTTKEGKVHSFELSHWETYDKDKFDCLAEIMDRWGIARPEHQIAEEGDE